MPSLEIWDSCLSHVWKALIFRTSQYVTPSRKEKESETVRAIQTYRPRETSPCRQQGDREGKLERGGE